MISKVHRNVGGYPQALSYLKKALGLQEKSLADNRIDFSSSCNNIGLLRSNLRDYSQAVLSLKRALAIREKTLSANYPDLASSYHNIGGVYYALAEYPRAKPYVEKAFKLFERSLPPEHAYLQTNKEGLENRNNTCPSGLLLSLLFSSGVKQKKLVIQYGFDCRGGKHRTLILEKFS